MLKGRDLFELHKSLRQATGLDLGELMRYYGKYMRFVVAYQSTQRQLLLTPLRPD
ncbi:hypothetical protein [Persicitalea sp.]|uniref:hypothetical protein n=1 Tax=Persicitalea sp. TaxID=3100273 RepID=UPI0035934C29